MIDHPIFFICGVLFLVRYFDFFDRYFCYYNKIMYPEYWYDDYWYDDINIDKPEPEEETTDNQVEVKEPPKYEEKFLNTIRKLNKEWSFTEDENKQFLVFSEQLFNEHVETCRQNVLDIESQISKLEYDIEHDVEGVIHFEELGYNSTLQDRTEDRRKQITDLLQKMNIINHQIEDDEGIEKIRNESMFKAKQLIVDAKLDKIKNCYVMEKTPVGNVIMTYDKDRESFKYYSDCNVPYRYLEVVGRKYVKMFDCRPIFIDMEEELKLFEEKWNKNQELKKQQQEAEQKKAEEAAKNKQPIKKNVFAKFKSYNKEAGGKISIASIPKNMNSKVTNGSKEDEKVLLKERANRYTHEGKFANFNFLQKVERKVFNKKLGVSYADFKKMKNKI